MAFPVSRRDANRERTAAGHNTGLHHHDDHVVDADDPLQHSFVYSVLPEARPAAATDYDTYYAYDGDDDGALHDDHDNDVNRVDERTREHTV